MTYGFYLLTCLILVVLQTTVMPNIPVLNSFFDLPTAFTIYLGLFRSTRESLPLIIVLGLVIDNLSGAPFLLYTTSFFCVFFGVRWLKGMLQAGTHFRLPILVTVGVLIENLIYIAAVVLTIPGQQSAAAIAFAVALQLCWAFVIGPFMVIGFKRLHQLWDNMVGTIFIKRADMTEREK